MKKLSSGMSINKAADDAAGLSISEGMRAQIRGLVQADRNTQDAVSLIGTAESVLGGVTDLIQRMRELTIQSLNDTLNDSDRATIQQEFRQLQLAINRSPNRAQWSGMPVVDMHEAQFSQIEGNHFFNGAVHVIDGYNNDLEIVIDGVSRRLTIAEGEYDPIEVLADFLDNELMKIDPNLIVHVTENRTISIQAENNKSIDYIKGGGSFLFYEYTPGNPPGMIIGVTEFKEGGTVKSITDKSDKLTFFVGSDREYTIKFPPGDYSREETINEINNQLQSKGETDVKAMAFGNERISLVSNKYVITGLGGNMIEVDDVTSVLYDNRKKGSIYKHQAVVNGYADVTSGIAMQHGVNDQLLIYIEGKKVDVQFLKPSDSERKLSAEEIVQTINAEFEKNGINATARINSTKLEIRSDYFGSQSEAIVDKQSSAFEDLFVRHSTTYQTISTTKGAEINASLRGNYGLSDSIMLDIGNNVLTGKVDDIDFELILDEKKYSKDELIIALNKQATEEGLSLEFTLSSSTVAGMSAIVVSHTTTGTGSFTLDSASSMFPTLMKGITITEPTVKRGTEIEIRPPEGIAEPPTYKYTPATATGKSSLTGIIITGENNKMTFNLNGEKKEILLLQGNYTKASDFLVAHESIFSNLGLIAKVGTGDVLELETENSGKDQVIDSFGGSSHDIVMGKRYETLPTTVTATGSVTHSTVQGIYKIPDDYVIDETNSLLTLSYSHEGDSHDISVQLLTGIYAKPELLVAQLEININNALVEKGLTSDTIEVEMKNGSISLSAREPGSEYIVGNLAGNLFDELFRRRETTVEPYAVSKGTTIESTTYIAGREGLLGDKEFIIHPHVNDRLLIDFHVNGAKQTLELKLSAGKYNGTELINELNHSLSVELKGMGHYPDLIKAQIGGIDSGTNISDSDKLVFKVNRQDDGRNDAGSYMIDGIRGNAAYTFFYQAQGEPAPTYTIGVTDLTSGAVIEEGKNDTFIFDVDNVEKKIVLPPGNYDAETLLDLLNTRLDNAKAHVVASYFEGHLKLSSKESGQISIDGIRGNARGTLFFKMDTRGNDPAWNFQVGANAGDSIKMEKVRMSAKLLRINTIMIDNPERAIKALQRLDSALGKISSERSRIGAFTNRLGHSMNIARQTAENLVKSESQIRDTDIAKELMQKVKTDILLQSSQLVLSKANANPQGVLELLK